LPRPAGLEGSWWFPAKEVKLQSEWSAPIDNLSVDQPLTRTILLMATGVGDTQLPQISVPVIDNISVYADTPTAATNTSERGVISQQTNTWAVIPQAAGTLSVPEVRVNWFDTVSGEARVAVLPAETLNVVGNNVGASSVQNNNQSGSEINAQANTDDNESRLDSDALAEAALPDAAASANTAALSSVANNANPQLRQTLDRWRNAAYALMAGWLLSLIGLWVWWRGRYAKAHAIKDKSSEPESSSMRFRRRAGSNAALAPIRAACDTVDASKISKAVLSWAAMVWPEDSPTNTLDVAKRLNSKPLVQTFDHLNAQQFRPEGSVNSVAVDSIADHLKQAVDRYQVDEADSHSDNALPSL